MKELLPYLTNSYFPSIRRGFIDTFIVNIGYQCDLECNHCYVSASRQRKEQMSAETCKTLIEAMRVRHIKTLDITGGAPEINPNYRELIKATRAQGQNVITRTGLTILELDALADLPEFWAKNNVEVIASLPDVKEEKVDAQRGRGIFARSIKILKKLNKYGFGKPDSKLKLNIAHNPQDINLPLKQNLLDKIYRQELAKHDVSFNNLYAYTNVPIGRFAKQLVDNKKFSEYLRVIKYAYKANNLNFVSCKTSLSIDYQGHVYDCEFNQLLGLDAEVQSVVDVSLTELIDSNPDKGNIRCGEYCYACTAAQGSGYYGALDQSKYNEAEGFLV